MSNHAEAKAGLSLVQQKTPTATKSPKGEGSASSPKVDIQYLVRALLKYNASDLHLRVGRPPIYRINGRLIPAKMDEFGSEQLEHLLFAVLSSKQRAELEVNRQIDLSFQIRDLGRFRCHIYYQKGGISAALQVIPGLIPTIDDLGLPPVLKELCQRPRGLLLITGETGSGKSTTQAAMVQHINENSHVHILTLEDPMEYLHRDMKATITQREVGSDTHSLKDGMRGGLRQDPDVIVISELRDCEMMQMALSAAETGHLVIASLSSRDSESTLMRILDGFPTHLQNQVRTQLATVLIGIVSQQLVLRADKSGRVPACEVMIKSPLIEGYIQKGEIKRIQEAMSGSNNYYKMQTMNQALEHLFVAGTISASDAVKASNNPEELKQRISSGAAREKTPGAA